MEQSVHKEFDGTDCVAGREKLETIDFKIE